MRRWRKQPEVRQLSPLPARALSRERGEGSVKGRTCQGSIKCSKLSQFVMAAKAATHDKFQQMG